MIIDILNAIEELHKLGLNHISNILSSMMPAIHSPPYICWCSDVEDVEPWVFTDTWRRGDKKIDFGFCDTCGAELTKKGQSISNADTHRIHVIKKAAIESSKRRCALTIKPPVHNWSRWSINIGRSNIMAIKFRQAVDKLYEILRD